MSSGHHVEVGDDGMVHCRTCGRAWWPHDPGSDLPDYTCYGEIKERKDFARAYPSRDKMPPRGTTPERCRACEIGSDEGHTLAGGCVSVTGTDRAGRNAMSKWAVKRPDWASRFRRFYYR